MSSTHESYPCTTQHTPPRSENGQAARNALAETLAELGYSPALVQLVDATETDPVMVRLSLVPEHAERIAIWLMHGISQGRIHSLSR